MHFVRTAVRWDGGQWPMIRRVAVSGATRAPRCRVAGTRYVSMRGLIGSHRVPPMGWSFR
eukprot:4838640-Prymnesium_polylepis.1